jgi:SAM-dependent methyltransferase
VASRAPAPPLELAHRVGAIKHLENPMELYEKRGHAGRDQIVSMLPTDWSFEGRRVLDFGCGAGRTLRHFLAEAEVAEFWGCDIDKASIAWLSEHLSPPIHAFRPEDAPPTSQPSGYFDLVYAISVFSHLTESWSEWLLELHRVLRDDGLLIATYMGEEMSERLANEPWEEDRIGMNVLRAWQGWDEGGPFVLHSDWWIQAHWGRAFEIVEVVPPSQIDPVMGPQSWALLRKRPGRFTAPDLESPEPGEEREVTALRHNVDQLQKEVADQRRTLLSENESLQRHYHEQIELRDRTVEEFATSTSWRITKPLRALAQKWRERR